MPPKAATGLDSDFRDLEGELFSLLSDENMFIEHGHQFTDGGEGGGGMRAHDDSPLELQLMTADI